MASYSRAPVAQRIRAPVFGTGCRRFESVRGYHNKMNQNKKILVVDDDVDLRTILQTRLTREGFAVTTAKNGKEGLDAALSQHPDLILLDVMMPEVTGLEMLKQLRADEWGKQVHVFMLTMLTGSEEKSQGMRENVSKYINKTDMNLDSLIWGIKSYLKS